MSKHRPSLVYVDDEENALIVVESALEEHFKVFVFKTPSAALKEIASIKPVIILSDLQMPQMNGVEFLELVQQIYPPAKRVILTGNFDEGSVIAAIKRAAIHDFLKKPLKGDILEAAMLKAFATFKKDEEDLRIKKKALKPDLMEHPSWLHKIASQLRESFEALPQHAVTDKQIEDWSILIHLCMSAEKRYYHNTQHLFDIWDVKDPFERLAILFHDVVYAQIDKNSVKGMLPQIARILGALVPNADLKLQLPEVNSFSDPSDLSMLYDIFGVKAGDVLHPMNGMNELLSARVAQKILGAVLTPWEVIQIASCIELTIPFRPKDQDGNFAPGRLLSRVKSLNKSRSLNLTDDQMESAVRRAVDVSNRDLWGFAAKDPADFLNGSWKLILEGNVPLQHELHSPKEYRTALEKMEGFLGFLKPEIVFQRIRKFPSDKDYADLLAQCQTNLEAGRIYFQAKILAMGLLEVIDALTGGNAPIEVFRGDIESESNLNAESLEKHFDNSIPSVDESETSQSVIELLRVRSESTMRYDLKNSPLAMYMYVRLNRSEFQNCIKVARAVFKEELEPFELLKSIPKETMISILRAITAVSHSRKTRIDQILKLVEDYVK